jgi:hypothetical protein
MKQKDFSKYWKQKKSNKELVELVPNLQSKNVFQNMINELSKVEDYRTMKHEHRILIMQKIFGNTEKQYNTETLGSEIQNAIKIGRQRLNG